LPLAASSFATWALDGPRGVYFALTSLALKVSPFALYSLLWPREPVSTGFAQSNPIVLLLLVYKRLHR
jgi:hypothetical protein